MEYPLYVPIPCGSGATCGYFQLTWDLSQYLWTFTRPWRLLSTQVPNSNEAALLSPWCDVCLVDGPTAHSQVCRPPESLLMELRCLPCWMHRMHWVICLVSFLFASGWEVGIYWFCWTAAHLFILSVMLVEVALFMFPLFLNLHPCSAEQFLLLALVNPHIHRSGRWKLDQRLITSAQL